MCATHFDAVSTTAGEGIDIQKLVCGDIAYGTEMQIRKYGQDGYDTYTYIEEAYDEEKDDFFPGWADYQDYMAKRNIAPGTPFWFKATANCDISIAGQILTDSDKTYAVIPDHFEMIANPFPVAVNPNEDIEMTGLSYGDQLQVRKTDGTGYDTLTYIEEAYDEEKDDFFPGWADYQDYLVKTPIFGVNQGAWAKTAKNVTVKFVNPIN